MWESELQPLQRSTLPPIKVTWQRTTVPEIPVHLPIDVTITIGMEAMRIRGRRTGLLEEECNVLCERKDILGVDIYLMSDIPDGTDPWDISEANLSIAIIRHADPFDVVPYFESVFTSEKAYWFKALAKGFRERMGIEVKLVEETEHTRKKRLLAASG